MQLLLSSVKFADGLSKIISYRFHKLRDSLDIVVLRANETKRAFPGVLPETSHSLQRRCDFSKILGIILAPKLVQIRHFDFSIQILI